MSLMRRLTQRDEARRGGESASVQKIVAQLEALDEPTARFLAAFAYVLARVAAADFEIDPNEETAIAKILKAFDGLDNEHIPIVVAIAREQAREEGGTENYLATREFRELSNRDERLRLLRALVEVAQADGHVSAVESEEIVRIADELDFSPDELKALRSDLRKKA